MSRRTGKPSYATRISQPARVRERPWAQVWRTVAGLIVAVAAGVLVGTQITGPGAAESAVASIRQQEASRDKAQIAELTARARGTAKAMGPVIDGLAASAAGVTAEQVAQWKQIVGKEVQWYSVTVSGTTATNVARGGLRTAVELLATAVDTAAAARSLPDGARQAVLQLVGRQRDLAVAGWSVAATQLDQINIDAGYGHQHVYLTGSGGSGVMTGDGLPEGTK